MPSSTDALRSLIDPEQGSMSIRRPCELLGLPRSTYYLTPARASSENLAFMRLIDEQHLEHPHMERKRMTQFTSSSFIKILQSRCIKISMDGKGRAIDNVYIERLLRSLNDGDIYLKAYNTVTEFNNGIESCFEHYSTRRPHQSLGGKTPKSVYEHAA